MPGQSVLSETVVKLSTQIDNSGVQRLLSLLESNRVKALALSAAFTGLTTAVYKFIESTTKQEYELQKLSKQQHKSIEQTRAETTALKAMGMTLNDIKKDAALKSMYDELVKFNKEMQMPNMARALENVNKLRLEFYKLKSALTYALQSIGAQILTNLEMPMNRIGGKLKTAATWIKDNMVNITSKVSSFITAFAKGIIAIAETFTKVTELIGQLPDGIKAIGLAIAAVFLTLKSGPLGQIIAVVSAIGDLMHDYEVYQWNKQNAENPQVFAADNESGYTKDPNDPKAKKLFGKAIPFQQKVAWDWIWEVIDSDSDDRTKATTVAGRVAEKINDVLTDAVNSLNNGEGSGMQEWLDKLLGPAGAIFGGIIDWVRDNPEAIGTIFNKLIETIASALEKAGEIGVELTGSVAKFIASVFGGVNWEEAWSDSSISQFLQKDNAFATGLATAVETALVGGNFVTSVITGVISGYKEAKNEALRKLYADDNGLNAADVVFGKNGVPGFDKILEKYKNDPRLAGEIGFELQNDFNTMISGILEALTAGFKIVGNAAGDLLKTIIYAIVGDSEEGAAGTIKAALNQIGKDNAIWKGLATGIGAWIATGNFWAGIAAGIVETLSSADGVDAINQAADEFKEMFLTLWDGALKEDGSGERTGVGLHQFLVRLFEGDENNEGLFDTLFTALSGLWEKISPYLEPLKTGLTQFFTGIFDSLTASLGAALSEGYIYFYNHFLRGGPLAGLFPDPNHANIEGNESDGYYLTNTANEGEKTLLTPEQAKVLAPFLGLMSPEGDGQYSFTGEAGVYNDMGFSYGSGFLGILPGSKTGKDFLNGLISGEISPEEFLSSFVSAIKWKEINGYNPEASENLGKNENNTNQTPEETKQPEPTGNTGKVPQPMATVASAGMSDSTTRRKMAESSESFDGLTKSTGEVADSHDDYLKVLEKVQEESKKATEKTETLGDTFGQLQIDSDTTKTKVTDLGTESETATPKITELGNAGSEAATKLRLAGETGDVSSSRMETAAGRAEGAAARFEAAAASAGAKPGKAWGGRVGSRGEYTVGEDGAEYIIPITKPERAFQLINQMLSEMGSSAIRRVMEGFGIGESGSIGASPASMASALQGMTMANTYNISAPVNINVNATGGSSKEIGTSIYDAAERHLIKTLRGVCA